MSQQTKSIVTLMKEVSWQISEVLDPRIRGPGVGKLGLRGLDWSYCKFAFIFFNALFATGILANWVEG